MDLLESRSKNWKESEKCVTGDWGRSKSSLCSGAVSHLGQEIRRQNADWLCTRRGMRGEGSDLRVRTRWTSSISSPDGQ